MQKKRVQVPEGGDSSIKDKFESVTTTVKKVSNYVPFENILNAKQLPKEDKVYYLMQSKSGLRTSLNLSIKY